MIRLRYRFDRNEQGSSLVEVALSFPILLFILVNGIELSLFLYQQAAIRYSLSLAARSSVIGAPIDAALGTVTALADPDDVKIDDTPDTTCNTADCLAAARVEDLFIEAAKSLGVSNDNMQFTVCPVSNSSCQHNSIGSGNALVKLTASKEISFLFYDVDLTASSSIVVRNEPF